jgi:hypothetical protein
MATQRSLIIGQWWCHCLAQIINSILKRSRGGLHATKGVGADGRSVKVEGCTVACLPLYPEEIFFRAFRYHEFDVSELSFSSYMRGGERTSACVAIPAFVSRIFRHSGIYIRRDAGIKTPADLRGNTPQSMHSSGWITSMFSPS